MTIIWEPQVRSLQQLSSTGKDATGRSIHPSAGPPPLAVLASWSRSVLLQSTHKGSATRACGRCGFACAVIAVIGIVHDWAWRRNHRYGTIVCDLERRRIVTLLPDREDCDRRDVADDHPEFEIVSRDRGGGYGEATARALSNAVQVADRWHLMENASAAFLDAVRKSMRTFRAAIGATTINPELLT